MDEKKKKEAEHKQKYGRCLLYSEECGPHKRRSPSVDGVFGPNHLTEDIRPHSVYLKLKIGNDWTEKMLIESRIGQSVLPDDVFCAYHRYQNGIWWKQPTSCAHPNHLREKGKKSAKGRVATVTRSLELDIPVGSILCHKHRLNNNDSIGEDQEDSDFVSPEVDISAEQMDMSIEKGDLLTSTLNVSPIGFRVKTKVDRLSNSTLVKLQRKMKRWQEASAQQFAAAVAPGQEEDLLAMLDDSVDETAHIDEIPKEVEEMVTLYSNSDSRSRIVILALFDQEKYSKEEVMRWFGCSRYKVDQARKWRASCKGLLLPQKIKHDRKKLDLVKAEHFIDFVFTSGLLQDVAYGTTNIRYESGEVQKIAHAVLTCKFSHTIHFYKETCDDVDYKPLSDSSLRFILLNMNPSLRKSLAGLDDTAADAMNAFDALQNHADKSLSDQLERGKRYLKTYYQIHCSQDNSKICSHSRYFALSDPKNNNLQCKSTVSTTVLCKNCNELCIALQKYIDIAKLSGDEDKMYDVESAVGSIIDFMKHKIRDAQQKIAKVSAFDIISCTVAFWLKDFAQKILPCRYREGMKEYFGKKGMTMHIDVFILKRANGELKKHVYVTLINQSDQGTSAVISIADVVLHQFRQDEPLITKLLAKSDNAGCYSANYQAESMYNLCKSKTMFLSRYDYNEPQCGKDQCDREAAAAKTIIRSYIDAKNDVTSAEDIYQSLHYGKGLKDAAVVVIQVEDKILEGKKIPGIQGYHSIEFQDKKMVFWRYYGIGNGISHPYNDLKVVSGATVVKPFSRTDKRYTPIALTADAEPSSSKKTKRNDRELCSLLFCMQPGCSSYFEKKEDYDAHMLAEDHQLTEKRTDMDAVKGMFVEKMKSLSEVRSFDHSSNVETIEGPSSNKIMSLFTTAGWAIPVRSNFRFSFVQKDLLYNLFIDGEKTGNKVSPDDAAKIIRQRLIRSEYVKPQQIKSLFSRWAKQLRENTLRAPVAKQKDNKNSEGVEEDEDEGESADEEEDEDEVEEYEDDDEEDDGLSDYQVKLTDAAAQACSMWSLNDWVVLKYNNKMFPGEIISISVVEDETRYVIDCLHESFAGRNIFHWPHPRDNKTSYSSDQVLCKISHPQSCNNRGGVKLGDDDYLKAKSFM